LAGETAGLTPKDMLMGGLVEAVGATLLLPNVKPPADAAGTAAGVEVPKEKALDDELDAKGALEPNVKADEAAPPPAASDTAPGLASSHDMHLSFASALLRVIHLVQSHSPGFALNISAREGWSDKVADAVAAGSFFSGALVPKEKAEDPGAAAPKTEDADAPGLASSHDRHLTLASALLRVMHLGQSHSPGLALNMSASEGWLDPADEVCPLAPGIADPEPFPMLFCLDWPAAID